MRSLVHPLVPVIVDNMFDHVEKYSMKKFNESSEYITNEWIQHGGENDEKVKEFEDDSKFIMKMFKSLIDLKKVIKDTPEHLELLKKIKKKENK